MSGRIAFIISTAFIIAGCTQKGKYYDPGQKDTTVRKVSYQADSTGSLATGAGFNVQGLQLFCNHEITPYCLLLPLSDFKEDHTGRSIGKAQHRFILKQDSAHFTSIEVQAFTIDKKSNYNTQLFYNRDKKDIAEGGLGIDTAYMNEAGHFYLIKGHLPGYLNMKYVQVNWILQDRIAVYLNYDEKDEALWNARITAIIKRGVKSQ